MSKFSIFRILGTWNAFLPPEGTLSWSASVPRSTKHEYLLYIALTDQTKNRKTEIPRTKMDLSMMQNGAVSNTCSVFKKCQPRPSQGVQFEGLQRDDLQCAGWFGHGDGVQQAMLQQRRNGARLPYHEFHPVYHSNIIRIFTGHWFWTVLWWFGLLKGVSLGDIQIEFQPQSTSPSNFWVNLETTEVINLDVFIWWASQKLCEITWTLRWFLGHGPPPSHLADQDDPSLACRHGGLQAGTLGFTCKNAIQKKTKTCFLSISFLYHTKYLVLYHVYFNLWSQASSFPSEVIQRNCFGLHLWRIWRRNE